MPAFRAGLCIGTDGQQAHVLDAASHHHVLDARSDEAVGEVGRLLARATLGVDGDARHVLVATVGQPGGASDVHGLCADLVDATADDLADVARLDPSTFEQRHLDGAEHIRGVGVRERPVLLADGRTDSFDDDDVGHGFLLAARCIPHKASASSSVTPTPWRKMAGPGLTAGSCAGLRSGGTDGAPDWSGLLQLDLHFDPRGQLQALERVDRLR